MTDGSTAVVDSFTAVFVVWGDRFGAAHIAALVRDISERTAAAVEFVAFADRPRTDLPTDVRVEPIPEPFGDYTRGTRAKLGQFVPGSLDPAKPAVFFDLDTMVTGDAAILAAIAVRDGGLTMLPATFGPSYSLLRLANRAGLGRMRGRINGSVYAYHPSEMADLPDMFLADMAANPDPPRWMGGHDRWLSVRAADRIRIWPPHLVGKFGDVFAHPLSSRDPSQLIALTFPGKDLGPDALLAAPDGARLTDRRGRRLIWDDAHTHGWASRIRAHWQAVEDARI